MEGEKGCPAHISKYEGSGLIRRPNVRGPYQADGRHPIKAAAFHGTAFGAGERL